MKTTPWVKSTRSNDQGQCVETRWFDGERQIRDSKNPDGGELTVSPEAFAAFIAAVKSDALGGPAA